MKKRYLKYVILSVLFFSVLSTVYQIAVVENPNFNLYDLGLNLLSEFAGMIFAVLVFNEFLSYRQQLLHTNKYRLLYLELEDLLQSLDFPFRAAAQRSMVGFTGDLWQKEVMETLREQIILSQVDDCVFPAVPWYMIFAMQGEKILRKCENIRGQYQDILEPQITDALFYLTNHSEMLTDLTDIKKIYENDLLLHYTRPPNLGSYFACPTERDLDVIRNLHAWSQRSQRESEKQAASIQKYKRGILLALMVIFLLGAVGYYVNGSYLSGGLFTALLIMLATVYLRFFKKKQRKQ